LADCDCDLALLFGGAKLPQLAKALGQSKKPLKMAGEGEEEAQRKRLRREMASNSKGSLSDG